MILKGQHKKSNRLTPLLLLCFILVGAVFFRFYEGKSNLEESSFESTFFDLENIRDDDFTSGDNYAKGAQTRSRDYAYSGDYSSKLDSQNTFGITYQLTNPIKGKTYKASVWRFFPHPVPKSYLVASAVDSDVFYRSVSKAVERGKDNWEKLELIFTIPKNVDLDLIKIYVFKDAGANPIYFDDLEITEVESKSKLTIGDFKTEELKLSLDQKARQYLSSIRAKSVEQGLVYHEDKMVKGKLNSKENELDIKLRYKGDWMDHLTKDPSYRIDLANDQSWKGMQSFSVQLPITRGFLREWVFFKFLECAEVLTPRFDFISWQGDKRKAKVFAYEEHFTKNLVENRNRREGPIVKMTEDRFWESMKRSMAINGNLATPKDKEAALLSSELKPFKEKKTASSPQLKAQFDQAQNLLHQFKYNLNQVSQVFDIELLAKYMALVDICLAHHAITWHNQRFYYNPVTSLLEPIGFDAFGEHDPKGYAGHIYAEKVYQENNIKSEPLDAVYFDPEFARLHTKYLKEYSNPEFIKSFLSQLDESVSVREKFLQNDYPDYKYDREEILNKALKIQKQLTPFSNALQCFEDERAGYIACQNTHGFPLEINLANGVKQVIFPRTKSQADLYHKMKYSITKNRKITFQLLGDQEQYEAKISHWQAPKNQTARQELLSKDLNGFGDILQDNGNELVISQSEVTIQKPLIIPKNKSLRINAGTKIIFEDEGLILCHGSIFINGTQEKPVSLTKANGNQGSLTILQADKRSELNYTHFENMNTLSYKAWQLTGAVNFYESNVTIRNCKFMNNECEDALNIIRSDFEISDSNFSHTFGDAFDADFCKGSLTNTHFDHTGNDAIDVSGSDIKILNCQLNQIGDKGISAGENSKVNAIQITIDQAEIAFASKDKSVLALSKVNLTNCKTGFAAYQKKPEFGPATISISDIKHQEIERLFMIEETSKLIQK